MAKGNDCTLLILGQFVFIAHTKVYITFGLIGQTIPTAKVYNWVSFFQSIIGEDAFIAHKLCF